MEFSTVIWRCLEIFIIVTCCESNQILVSTLTGIMLIYIMSSVLFTTYTIQVLPRELAERAEAPVDLKSLPLQRFRLHPNNLGYVKLETCDMSTQTDAPNKHETCDVSTHSNVPNNLVDVKLEICDVLTQTDAPNKHETCDASTHSNVPNNLVDVKLETCGYEFLNMLIDVPLQNLRESDPNDDECEETCWPSGWLSMTRDEKLEFLDSELKRYFNDGL